MKHPHTVIQLPFTAETTVQDALSRIGRTEDIQFSPDNRWLVIAAYFQNCLLLIRLREPLLPPFHLEQAYLLQSDEFHEPHGVDFLDPVTLVVANRQGKVVLVSLPADGDLMPSSRVVPFARIDRTWKRKLRLPSSLTVVRRNSGAHDLYVCDNYGRRVTRHSLDTQHQPRRFPGRVLLQDHLNVPDGIAVSPDRQWIAVSNHGTHSVLLFKNSWHLYHHSKPEGTLTGLCYPHGLRFTPCGRLLLVADAGDPTIKIYMRPVEGWAGTHHPGTVWRVMEESIFQRGRLNPQEGGPKGLAIDRSGKWLAITSEFQPLAFFQLETDMLSSRTL